MQRNIISIALLASSLLFTACSSDDDVLKGIAALNDNAESTTIYRNGNIITLNEANDIARAVVIENGRIRK